MELEEKKKKILKTNAITIDKRKQKDNLLG